MNQSEKHPLAAQRRKHLREASLLPAGKRFSYYIYYFKGWLIGIPLTLFLCFFFLNAFFSGPQSALYGYFVNAPHAMNVEDDIFLENFISFAQIDMSKEKVYFNSAFSLQNANQTELSKLMSALTTGEIDFFVCEENAFRELAQEGLLSDLNSWMTLQESASYRNRIIHYEPSDSESTKEPSLCKGLPVAIDVTDSMRLQETGAFEGESHIYFCVAVNAPHKERTLLFLQWLLAE